MRGWQDDLQNRSKAVGRPTDFGYLRRTEPTEVGPRGRRRPSPAYDVHPDGCDAAAIMMPDTQALASVLAASVASERAALDTLLLALLERCAEDRALRERARLALGLDGCAETAKDGWMDTKKTSAYLGLPLSTLHRLTAARTIPFEQDGPGCKCWFKRSELDEWRRRGQPARGLRSVA